MREKRWRSIASSIKVAIQKGELASGARIASETEMASQWNVSPMTVHRAMSDLQREGWVIRRPKIGTVVADPNSRPLPRVALVFNTLSDQPQSDYLTGIEDTLSDGYQLLPLRAGFRASNEASLLARAESECDAVIMYASGDPANTAVINRIAERMPLVLVDRLPEGVNADIVATDNQASIIKGLEYIYALGHRRIAYLMEDFLQVSAVRERRAGYVHFMSGIGADPQRWMHVLPPTISREAYYERIETILAELLSEENPVTAVACQQAVTMGAVLEACVRLGVSPPDELAVLGFNDHSPGHQPLVRNAYILVQRSVEMGHVAARRIQYRLANLDSETIQTRIMADFFPAQPYRPSPAASRYLDRRRAAMLHP